MISPTMGWNTSASTRKVAVSDQLRADTVMVRPPRRNVSFSNLVKGHGPAMQEARTFRNSLLSPASNVRPPILAFHLPSGEQGCCPRSEEHTSELQSHSDRVCSPVLDPQTTSSTSPSLHDALPICGQIRLWFARRVETCRSQTW